jgi:hypothetical protein
MRRHARQLADRVDAAETTSSCAWFCAWSSSQSSSPRTSSWIWLFSPYCPPSHKRWRSSEQCSRESTALHSDYYSTMRKTATPLNESWTAEAAALLAAPTAPARAMRRAACSSRSLHARREISSCAKIPCAAMVFDTRTDLRDARRNGRVSTHTQAAAACRRRPRRILRPQKNFRSEPLETRVDRKISIENVESPWVIRPRARRSVDPTHADLALRRHHRRQRASMHSRLGSLTAALRSRACA